MSNEEILEILTNEYDDIKSSEEIRKLIEVLKTDKATYKDLYEFANGIGGALGIDLKAFLENMNVDDVSQFISILERYNKDINEAGVVIQTRMNEADKIRIKGQSIAFDRKDAEMTLREIVFRSDADVVLSTYGLKIVDRMIEKNADFLSRTGYGMVIVRKYDNVGLRKGTKHAESCDWCLERVGVFGYPPDDFKVFERHEGCKCSIDLKYDGATEKVMNYKKRIK